MGSRKQMDKTPSPKQRCVFSDEDCPEEKRGEVELPNIPRCDKYGQSKDFPFDRPVTAERLYLKNATDVGDRGDDERINQHSHTSVGPVEILYALAR